MNTSTKSRLEAIIAAHESEIAREQDRIDQEHMAEVLFAQHFEAVKKTVIVPAFVDLEGELKRHGHVCKIVEADEINFDDQAGGCDSVTCEFYPKGWNHGDGASLAGPPSLTVVCEKESRSVKLLECTFGPLDRGWSGELGACGLEEITPELITEVFLALVEKILLDKTFIAKSTQNLRPSWSRPGMHSPARPRIARSRHAA